MNVLTPTPDRLQVRTSTRRVSVMTAKITWIAGRKIGAKAASLMVHILFAHINQNHIQMYIIISCISTRYNDIIYD